MKKMHKFVGVMEYTTTTNNLMNYELQGSNSNNYGTSPQTSSPNSFPVVMENGILIKFEMIKFESDIVNDDKASSE